jgi:hypothetical protein
MSNYTIKQCVPDSRLTVSVLAYLNILKGRLEIINTRGDDFSRVYDMAFSTMRNWQPKDRREQIGYMLSLRKEPTVLVIEKNTPSKTIVIAKITCEE